MRKDIRLVVGVVAQLAFGGSSFAQSWTPKVLKVNDPDSQDTARVAEGRLRKTDEEFTNEMGVVQMFADGKRGLYLEMRTGALPDGSKPVHRMQCAVTPIELVQNADGSVEPKKLPGEHFITDNRGNEYRNCNKPQLMPVNGGKSMLFMFNYQPEGGSDTRRYAKVLDLDGNALPIKDKNGDAKKQVLIMAKNNDDCDMHQTGEGPCDVATDENGNTHLTCWAGCNGNGTDDGWINDINVKCDNDAAGKATGCQIIKNFDASLAQREERSRGRCSTSSADPNTAICTWTEGNNQPQRDGTWIAAIDISPGGKLGGGAQERILWKKMIQGRKELKDGVRTYSVRAKSSRVLVEKADGTLEKSDMLILQTGDLEGRNNDDRKGGRYRQLQLGVARATKAGLEWVVPMTNTTDLLLGIDGTHLSQTGVVIQDKDKLLPGVTFLQGSHNGGGRQSPDLKVLAVDLAAKKFVDYGTHAAGGSYDRHLYSNYLGNNPGNQGRNFAGSVLVKNPFVGQNGATAKYLLLHALTGKDPAHVDQPQLKPASFVTVMPMMAPPPPAAPPPPSTGTGTGTNMPAPTAPSGPGSGTGTGMGMGSGTGSGTGSGSGNNNAPAPEEPAPEAPAGEGQFSAGCSMASRGHGANAFLIVVLAVAFIVARRRWV